ncbi:NUDIX hydrolase [Solibacillus silvestris]|uniref:NUDIX hydrolase n=1 Tax=Solibacillus silvestris TaxID=76853 RepID=UPI003F7F8A89
MEYWDLYDVHRVKVDRTVQRGQALQQGQYHMVVHICIFNSDGEMLIQQRQPFKEGWPNMWDISAGGSAVAGETSQLAAQRELFEEIGYEYDFQNIRPHFTVNFERGFDDYYLIFEDVPLHTLTLQYEEVKNVKWASMGQISEMIQNGEFIPYYESFIQLLFQNRKQRGTVQR